VDRCPGELLATELGEAEAAGEPGFTNRIRANLDAGASRVLKEGGPTGPRHRVMQCPAGEGGTYERESG
jgi:hypothetical protein